MDETNARNPVSLAAMGTLTARDVMATEVQVARLGDSLRDCLEKLQAGSFRRMPVLDAHDRLVGIITDRDIRLATNSPFVMHDRWQDEMVMAQVQADVCMTPDPITAAPETPVYELARLMRTRKIGGLPIVEAGRLVGLVTETDLLRTFEDLLRQAAER